MKIAVNIDKIPVLKDGAVNVGMAVPAIMASLRKAEIIFHSNRTELLSDKEQAERMLNLVPGKASLVIGRPKADIYLGG
jgi:hypothetical protein